MKEKQYKFNGRVLKLNSIKNWLNYDSLYDTGDIVKFKDDEIIIFNYSVLTETGKPNKGIYITNKGIRDYKYVNENYILVKKADLKLQVFLSTDRQHPDMLAIAYGKIDYPKRFTNAFERFNKSFNKINLAV
jgi:hypothetical protein